MLKIPPFDWLRVVSEVEPPDGGEGTGGEVVSRNHVEITKKQSFA